MIKKYVCLILFVCTLWGLAACDDIFAPVTPELV